MKYNLTIDGTNNIVTIDYLKEDGVYTTVTGTDYFKFSHLKSQPYPADKAGWWFDLPDYGGNYQTYFKFADIVNLNGSGVGVNTHADITALLKAAIS